MAFHIYTPDANFGENALGVFLLWGQVFYGWREFFRLLDALLRFWKSS
jgi:hypothetical protein